MMQRKINNQKGWIFIDALIALTIVMVALLSLAAVYNQSISTSVYSEKYLQALNLAQSKVEELKNNDCGILPANTSEQNGIFTITSNIVSAPTGIAFLNSESQKLVPIEVTVKWTESNKNQSISLSYYYISNLTAGTLSWTSN